MQVQDKAVVYRYKNDEIVLVYYCKTTVNYNHFNNAANYILQDFETQRC